jgi:hypothetical protein
VERFLSLKQRFHPTVGLEQTLDLRAKKIVVSAFALQEIPASVSLQRRGTLGKSSLIRSIWRESIQITSVKLLIPMKDSMILIQGMRRGHQGGLSRP